MNEKASCMATSNNLNCNGDAETDIFSLFMSVAANPTTLEEESLSDLTYKGTAKHAYNSWMNLQEDWYTFLTITQKVDKNKINASKVKQRNCFYLTGEVDILLWWRINLAHHCIVSRVASLELARPSSNALQERVFSFCKLLGTPLCQKLSNDKFEMLSVLVFNQEFVKEDMSDVLNIQQLVNLLHSAALASEAAKQVVKLFGLFETAKNEMDADSDNHVDEISIMLKHAEDLANSKPTSVNRHKRGCSN